MNEQEQKWIATRDEDYIYILKCPKCGYVNHWGIDDEGYSTYNYCPVCGEHLSEGGNGKDCD